jgi:hypothetical protein
VAWPEDQEEKITLIPGRGGFFVPSISPAVASIFLLCIFPEYQIQG